MFKYGDLEAELDLARHDHMDRWEKAFGELPALYGKADKEKTYAAKMKGIVDAIAFVLDTVFADESAANIALGGTTSVVEAMDALDALIAYATEHGGDDASRISTILSKYGAGKRKAAK